MGPIEILLMAWGAINVLVVLLAINGAASRKRAFRATARRMVDAAEVHANSASPASAPPVPTAVAPLSSVRRPAGSA